VERGEVPSSSTLDAVGFFAEHAIDLPAADCGANICVHSSLAVAPRFNGDNWTMAFVALNSPVDPAAVSRPPVHVVLALERSSLTRGTLWLALREALRELTMDLRPEDLVSLVAFSHTGADLLAEGVDRRDPAIGQAFDAATELFVGDSADLYAGLATASTVAQQYEDHAARIMLVTSGVAGRGITDPERILALGESIASSGTGLSVIGLGDAYDDRLPSALGEMGAGNYYFAQDETDLQQIFSAEAATTLVPLATNFELRVAAAPGYRVGRIYGARRATAQSAYATLSSPALFLGHRTGSTDTGEGRRGGGGGLFVELMADSLLGLRAGEPAFTVEASFEDTASGELETSSAVVTNWRPPGQNPDEMWPEFSDEARAQAFMMLNMYLALKSATELYEAGDCARAIGLVDMVDPTIPMWQDRYDNPDIWADYDLLMQLRMNLLDACAAQAPTPIQPTQFSGGCMGL
jgi:Ca-activated chloride channel family protein